MRNFLIGLAAYFLFSLPVQAAQLVMVEEPGCPYCALWNSQIGPIYAKTPEGAFAPLLRVDKTDGPPEGVAFKQKVVYTPTFILVEDGDELARIEGYPGEDFFWGLLEVMLLQNTSYSKPPSS